MIIEISEEELNNMQYVNIKDNWEESCYYWYMAFDKLTSQLKNNTLSTKGETQGGKE